MKMLSSRKRLLLRTMQPDDLEFLFRIENDPRLRPYTTNTGYYSRKLLRDYIRCNHNDLYMDKQLRLMIEQTEGKGDVVGIIDLFQYDDCQREAELGIVIDEPYRRQGYASEAIETLTAHCFGQLAFRQLTVSVHADNTPALNLFAKEGFVPQCT